MRTWGGLFLTAVACLLVAAPAAMANQVEPKRFEVKEPSFKMLLFVREDDDYRASITTNGHRQVTLALNKGKAEVEARTEGEVNSRGIEADFGELGRISLRFKPDGPPAVGETECRGRPRLIGFGTFEGTIQFGGDGLPQLDATKAWGLVRRRYRQVCPAGSQSNPIRAIFEKLFGKARITKLRSHARAGSATVLFEANAADLSALFGGEGYESNFTASLTERRDGVRLTRSIGAEGGEGSFLFSKQGTRPRPRR